MNRERTPAGPRRDREVNDQLRRARSRTPSPADANRPMSRQELAEAVNAHVHRTTGQATAMDAHYVGRLERGLRRWPGIAYRNAFRAVLGVSTDSALGFRQRGQLELDSPPSPQGRSRMRMETIRFASRNNDETYFFRTIHQLAAGCLLLGAQDDAVAAVLEVMGKAVAQQQARHVTAEQ
jgi:transcriptional regulator with XRE-family HTH domain